MQLPASVPFPERFKSFRVKTKLFVSLLIASTAYLPLTQCYHFYCCFMLVRFHIHCIYIVFINQKKNEHFVR